MKISADSFKEYLYEMEIRAKEKFDSYIDFSRIKFKKS
jgi:hypothetical protein